MKQILSVLLFAALFITSCKKEDEKLPSITLKTGGSYVSADKTVAKGESVSFGIIADKSEGADVLKTMNYSTAFDGAAATSVTTFNLTADQATHYEKDLTIVARNVSGKEKHIFTITNGAGQTNQVSVTLTVQ